MTLLLLALGVWTAAAALDVRTRRVPNAIFGVLAALGALRIATGDVRLAALAASVGVVWPVAVLVFARYDVGGADAKALMAGAVLYPAAIGGFLVGSGVGVVACNRRWSDEVPALPAFLTGAVVATALYAV